MGLFILFKPGKTCGVTSPPGLDSQRVNSASTWQRWLWRWGLAGSQLRNTWDVVGHHGDLGFVSCLPVIPGMFHWQRVTLQRWGAPEALLEVWERPQKKRKNGGEKKSIYIKRKKEKGEFVATNPCCRIPRLEEPKMQRRRSGARRARALPQLPRSNTAPSRLRCCQNPAFAQATLARNHGAPPAAALTSLAVQPVFHGRRAMQGSGHPHPGWGWDRWAGFLPCWHSGTWN